VAVGSLGRLLPCYPEILGRLGSIPPASVGSTKKFSDEPFIFGV